MHALSFLFEVLTVPLYQIRKMDLEARSLPPGVKSSLLVKLREFKSDLNNFKTEVKRITSANSNAAARDQLLEADTKTVSKRTWIFSSKTYFD